MARKHDKSIPDPSGFGTALYDEIAAWVSANAQELTATIVGGSWDDHWVRQQQARAADAVALAHDMAQAELAHLQSAAGAAEWEEYRRTKTGQRECPTLTEQVAIVEAACHLLDDWPGMGDPPAAPPPRVLHVQWQSPVRCARGTIQYIDVLVEYELDALGANVNVKGVTGDTLWRHIARERFPTLTAQDMPRWGVTPPKQSHSLGFLIRPRIPALAPLVREAHTLAEYRPGRYVIVSPDTRFQVELESQDFDFAAYDAEKRGKTAPDDPTALLLAFAGGDETL